MTFSAISGRVRSGRPVVALQSRETAAVIRFVFRRGDAEVGEATRAWPGDFRFEDAERPDVGVAVLDEAAAFEPYSRIEPVGPAGAVALPHDWALDPLFPTTEAAFERSWFKDRHRVPDRESLHFAARQANRHYTLNETHRCVTGVVEGYSAIELGDDALCAEAIVAVRDQIARAAGLPSTPWVRTDGPHQLGSLYAALWQLLLHQGRYEEMTRALDAFAAHLKASEGGLGRAALNGCMALLARVYVHALEGEAARARDLAEFSTRFYARNLLLLEPKAQWFKENQKSHVAVILALETVERLETGKELLKPATVIAAAHRIEGAEAAEFLAMRFRGLRRRLEKDRAA